MVKAINCSGGTCKPRFTGKNGDAQKVTGFNKPKKFFANFKRTQAAIGAYGSGVPASIGNGILAGGGVYALLDLGSKINNHGKNGTAIVRPWIKDIISPIRKLGSNAFKGIGEKTFPRGIAQILTSPFKTAGEALTSLVKKGTNNRSLKILALVTCLAVAAHGIVKTKMALNRKNAEIDHSFKVQHNTTIPENAK